MKKQYKYAFAGLGFLGSTATSIYFGVRSFFPTEPPFRNTAYQKQYAGHEFIRGNHEDSEWTAKSDIFLKELSEKSKIDSAFKDAGGLGDYSHIIDSGYDSKDGDEKKRIVKRFLYEWCLKNRASTNESIFNLISSWCVKNRTAVAIK